MRAWNWDPPFVGRERELLELRDALGSRALRPGVFVAGEAGIGKSRLVHEFATWATAQGATVVAGGCLQDGQDSLPFAPFVEALGRLHEVMGSAADEVFGGVSAEIAAIVPGLGAPHVTVDRIRLFESVRILLDRVPDPSILIIEDAQWADASSVALLSYLVRRVRHARLLTVTTFRSDEVSRRSPLALLVAELTRGQRAVRFDLQPLAMSELARLIASLRPDISALEADAIAARSDGNAFLALELLGTTDPSAAELPPTLRDVLLQMVGSLSPSARLLLATVATAGRAVSESFLEAVWKGTGSRLDMALREGLERGVIVRDPTAGTIRIRHALIADAVREDTGPRRRTELHGRIAAVLSVRPDLGDRTEAGAAAEIATHLAGAGRHPEALEAACRAAEIAARVPAWAESYAHYRRSIELWDRVPETQRPPALDRTALLHAAAEAAYMAFGVAPALALEQEAIRVCPVDASARLGARYAALARWHVERSDALAMMAAAEQAVALVPAAPASQERGLALASLASARMQWCRYASAIEAGRQAAAIAASTGATPMGAWAHAVMGLCLAELGQDEAAQAESDAAVSLAATPPAANVSADAWAVISAYGDRLAVLRRRQWGDPAELGRAFDELRAAADRFDVRAMASDWASGVELYLLYQAGRWDELVQRLGPRRSAAADVPSWILTLRGSILIARGMLEEGETDLRGALAGATHESPELAAQARFDLALSALTRRQPGRALEITDESLRRLEETEAPILMARTAALGLRAAADLACQVTSRRRADLIQCSEGSVARARATVEAASAGTLVAGMGLGPHVEAAIAWGQAEVGRPLGASQPQDWSCAASRLDSFWRPDLVAYAQYREAEAILACKTNKAAAAVPLRAAHDRATQLGMAPLLAEICALARRARIDLASSAAAPPEPTPAPGRMRPYGLSVRECEVLALLVDGRTNREIGSALYISEKTASVHVTHILGKLDVNSRGAAAALAARLGLLEAGPEATAAEQRAQ